MSNLDNYFESYGPTGARHLLNLSGLVDFPATCSLASSPRCRAGAGDALISNVDLDGDGTATTPIPACRTIASTAAATKPIWQRP